MNNLKDKLCKLAQHFLRKKDTNSKLRNWRIKVLCSIKTAIMKKNKNLRVTLYESRRQSAGNKQIIHVCFRNLYTPSTPTHKHKQET